MQDVIASKRCFTCRECLPVGEFRPARNRSADGLKSSCRDCENDRRRQLRGRPARRGYHTWTAVEDSLLRQLYPGGGVAAVQAVMPDRNANSIKQRACRLDVQNAASPYSKRHRGEPLWEVPAHDYAPEDRAWMAARLPVFSERLTGVL